MPDPKNLPHLLNLLDDDSEFVHETVLRELAGFGSTLLTELDRLPEPPDAVTKAGILELLAARHRRCLRQAWPKWLELTDEAAKLEAALDFLAEFQRGGPCPTPLSGLLDALAAAYRAAHGKPDARTLAAFLFQEQSFAGTEGDYYHPDNSDLVSVIERKRGLPISLVCLYMLVGRRLGLDIAGCNYPQHFLARIAVDGRPVFVDCFNGANLLLEEDLVPAHVRLSTAARQGVLQGVRAEVIVQRVLRNLIHAYRILGDGPLRELIEDLLAALEKAEAISPTS